MLPSPDVLLALEPEELAWPVLLFAKENTQNGMMHLGNLLSTLQVVGLPSTVASYSEHPRAGEIELAIIEAWNWLCVQGLLVPVPNQPAPWFRLSRRARKIDDDEKAFARFREAADFPKSLLHPSIAEKVWIDLIRGDLADAVFVAFRTVEEAVRKAGGYSDTDVGTVLMRKAFDKESGPLTDKNQPEGEREALAHLFAGAIGSYKNPHSHRTVTINDPREAQEMAILASHLLRIVETRATSRQAFAR